VDKVCKVDNEDRGSIEIEMKLIKEGVKGKWGKKDTGDKSSRNRQSKHHEEKVKG
jgi:hypothetical protein